MKKAFKDWSPGIAVSAKISRSRGRWRFLISK
jgi:hypothetical protein